MIDGNPTQGQLTVILDRAFDLEEQGELEAAIVEFEKAAHLGSTDACSKLGTIYGDVIAPPQPERAIYWYQKGVDAGDSSCAWNLAMHYAGVGDRANYERWLWIARQMGDADAALELRRADWWKKRNGSGQGTEAGR